MKTIRIYTLLLVVGMIAWTLYKSHRSTINDAAAAKQAKVQQLEQWRKEGKTELTNAVAQQLVGFTRVVDSHISDDSEHPYQWRAEATAEFINKVGGIERTNMPFTFSADLGGLRCYLDEATSHERDQAAFLAQLKAIEGSK